jgi:hypothetical protein
MGRCATVARTRIETVMRQLRATTVIVAMVAVGCSSADLPEPDAEPAAQPEEASQEASEDIDDVPDEDDPLEGLGDVEVDRGLLNVEVTLPPVYFEGQSPEDILSEARGDGISDVTVNPDGSVTYRMSKMRHRELMQEINASLRESLVTLPDDFSSVQEVTVNQDVTAFRIVADQAAYESSLDGFVIFAIAMQAGMYHLFDGATSDSYRVTIDLVDAASGTVFDTVVLPDDFEE